MPKKNIRPAERISGYVEKLITEIQGFHPYYREEKLHRFRTTTKKLRAWLRTGGLAEKGITKDFKKMYKAAGEIRDAQVLIIRLAGEKHNQPWFILWLAGYICRKQKKLRKRVKVFDIDEWKSNLSAMMENWPLTDMPDYCQTKIREVYRMRTGVLGDVRIHTIRKSIKDVLYLRSPDNAGQGGSRDEILLKKTDNSLGYYVDICHSIALLKNYLKHESDFQRRRQAGVLLQYWIKEKQRNKKSIHLMLKRKSIAGLPFSG